MRSQGDSTVLLLDTAGGLNDHPSSSARASVPARLGRYELMHEIETGALDPHDLRGMATVGLSEFTLTDEQRADFVERVKQLLDSYDVAEPMLEGRARFRVLVAGFPLTR